MLQWRTPGGLRGWKHTERISVGQTHRPLRKGYGRRVFFLPLQAVDKLHGPEAVFQAADIQVRHFSGIALVNLIEESVQGFPFFLRQPIHNSFGLCEHRFFHRFTVFVRAVKFLQKQLHPLKDHIIDPFLLVHASPPSTTEDTGILFGSRYHKATNRGRVFEAPYTNRKNIRDRT